MECGGPSEERLRRAFRERISSVESATGYRPEGYREAASRADPAFAIQALVLGSASDDSLQLWARMRLDLTAEAFVASAPWAQLFTPEARRIAEERLRDWNGIQPMEAAAALVESAAHPLYGVEEIDWGE